jgi:hypothetical protein
MEARERRNPGTAFPGLRLRLHPGYAPAHQHDQDLHYRIRFNRFCAERRTNPIPADIPDDTALSAAVGDKLLRSQPAPRCLSKKYRRSAMENAPRLQCKPLREREKRRRRKNNGYQWEKQCEEQWEQ